MSFGSRTLKTTKIGNVTWLAYIYPKSDLLKPDVDIVCQVKVTYVLELDVLCHMVPEL